MDDFLEGECCVCHRGDRRGIYTLNLVPVPQPTSTRKRFGDMSLLRNPNSNVCTQCSRYVLKDNPATWVNAWPATIWSMLSGISSGFSFTMADERILHMIPREIRKSWRNTQTFTESMRRNWFSPENTSRFVDVTDTLAWVKHIKEENKIVPVMKMVKETVFPNIKCPMGCNLHIDDILQDPPRAQLIPLPAYIQREQANFTSFQSSSTKNPLIGSRPDYPRQSYALGKYLCSAAIVFDQKKGLCIYACSNDTHSFGKPFLHMMTNPFMDDFISPFVDQLAPARPTPDVIRAGKANRFTKSFNVVKQRGNAGGLDTMHINVGPGDYPDLNHKQILSHALVLRLRSDIRDFIANTEGAQFIKAYDDYLELHMTDSLKELIEKCMSSGTFVTTADAIHSIKTFNSRGTSNKTKQYNDTIDDGNECLSTRARAKMDDILRFIHPNNNIGHPPIRIRHIKHTLRKNQSTNEANDKTTQTNTEDTNEHNTDDIDHDTQQSDHAISREDVNNDVRRQNATTGDTNENANEVIDYGAGCLLYTVIQILVHCPPLHRLFLNEVWNGPAGGILSHIQYVCLNNANYSNHTNFWKELTLDERMKYRLTNIVDEDISQTELVQKFICNFLPLVAAINVPYIQHKDYSALVATALKSCDSDYAFLRVDGENIRRSDIPEEFEDWILMLNGKIDPHNQQEERYYNSILSFRWLENFQFQDAGTRPWEINCIHGRERSQYAIYVRRDVLESLDQNEVVNWTGGQVKAKCAVHDDFLIREYRSGIQCTSQGCKTEIRWRCPDGICSYQCQRGLCFKHMKKLSPEDQPHSIDFHTKDTHRPQLKVPHTHFPANNIPTKDYVNNTTANSHQTNDTARTCIDGEMFDSDIESGSSDADINENDDFHAAVFKSDAEELDTDDDYHEEYNSNNDTIIRRKSNNTETNASQIRNPTASGTVNNENTNEEFADHEIDDSIIVEDFGEHSDDEYNLLDDSDDEHPVPTSLKPGYGIDANTIKYHPSTVPLHTSGIQKPVYATADNLHQQKCGSHFIINDVLCTMRKTGYTSNLNVNTQKILQSIDAVCGENSHILMHYPEAMLFPNLFWCPADNDPHAMVGAMPGTMYATGNTRATNNLASLHDHIAVRLRDNDLLSSHDDPYLHWLFDVFINESLNRNSSAVLVRKGLEHMRHRDEGLRIENRENNLKFDEMDARRQVKRLSSLMREIDGFDIFFTATCNDTQTFGVKEIRDAIENYHWEDDNIDEALEAYCGIICRVWERTMRYFLDWIRHSPEKSCGEVSHLWARFEFQGQNSPGNKPHVHGLFRVENESKDKKLQRIRGMLRDMWDPAIGTDYDGLKAAGFIDTIEEYGYLQELCQKLQVHICENGQHRCLVVNRKGEVVCRVQKHPPGDEYKFDSNPNLYNTEVMDIMERLGLTKMEEGVRVPIEELQGGRYQVPAAKGEVFSPTYPLFFIILMAVCNAQYVDGRMGPDYLSKYCAGKDDKRRVHFKKTGDDEISVEVEDLHNEKIHSQEQLTKQKAKFNLARDLSKTEMLWAMHKLPFVYNECTYTHVGTHPPEYRSAITKRGQGASRIDGGDGGPVSVQERRKLKDPWRHFTQNQDILLRQFIAGSYYLDSTTAFSIRPPELMSVSNLEKYSKWFIRNNTTLDKYEVNENLSECPWIDGSNKRIHIRQHYIEDVAKHFQTISVSNHPRQQQAQLIYNEIFSKLRQEYVDKRDTVEPYSDFYRRFVDSSATKPNVVVFTPVSALQLPTFLIHLCLTMGNIDTELDLLTKPNLAEAMTYAGIISSTKPTRHEIDQLIRRYVMEQLRWLNVSAKRFARIIQYLDQAVPKFFEEEIFMFEAMPLALDAAITEKSEQDLEDLQQTRRDAAITALQAANVQNFPVGKELQKLRSGDPCMYTPTLSRAPEQSDESFNEQHTALNKAKKIVDNLLVPDLSTSPMPLFCGPPGAGKTHLLLMLNTYCMAKGFNTMLTAATSERARCLGGEHIHLLFGIPGDDLGVRTVHNLAEMSISKLVQNPVRLQSLKAIKILLIEEIGMVSAEMLALMDLILRRIRHSSAPFGGVLLMATGDPRQLPPVQGHSVWTSYHMITTFKILLLQHYVRCAADTDLRRMNDLLRISKLTDNEMDEFMEIFHRRCDKNFVEDWDDVSPDILRVLPTKQAVEEATQRYVKKKISELGNDICHYLSYDTVEISTGRWKAAQKTTRIKLDRNCLEPRNLHLFKGAIMRLTYNRNITPRFSQGQLCVVTILPPINAQITDLHDDEISEEQREKIQQLRRGERITVKLIPPGVRQVDPKNIPDHWPAVELKRHEAIPTFFNRNNRASCREQWPLTYYVASTVHKVIGETCPRLATQLDATDKKYTFWERSMLLVLISRVRSLDGIIFVGDLKSTTEAIRLLLMKSDPTAELIESTLSTLNGLLRADRIVKSAYVQLSFQLPKEKFGCVYFIASSKITEKWYVGETNDLLRRQFEHNNGTGSKFTQDRFYAKWALLAVITGFPGSATSTNDKLKNINLRERSLFEQAWQKEAARYQQQHGTCSPVEAEIIGRRLFKRTRDRYSKSHRSEVGNDGFRWLDCGRLRNELQ